VSDNGTTIVWFRRDLRLTDNPALDAACERSRPRDRMYVHGAEEDGEWAPAVRAVRWLHHSLAAAPTSHALPEAGQLTFRPRGSLDALLAWPPSPCAQRVHWNRL